jgi:hypothetical protein
MACSGSHCTNHGTGTTTCAGHRAVCSTNRPLAVGYTSGIPNIIIEDNKDIKVDIIEDYRQKIREELTRWNLHRYYNYTLLQPTAYTTSTIITDDHVEELNSMVTGIYGGTVHSDKDGLVIEDTDWYNDIAIKYEWIRKNCICNSDCACNNVCTCNNDCSCNYSDIRLKKDVRLLH